MLPAACDLRSELPSYAIKQKGRKVREQEDWLSTGRNGRRDRASERVSTDKIFGTMVEGGIDLAPARQPTTKARKAKSRSIV